MYHQPPAPAASQQWGGEASRVTSVGLLGAASLVSFGEEIHCLRGSSSGCASACMSMCAWAWPCVSCDISTTSNTAKQIIGISEPSQLPVFPRIRLLTPHVLMETAAASSHRGLLWATRQSRRRRDRERQLSGTFLQGYTSQAQSVN